MALPRHSLHLQVCWGCFPQPTPRYTRCVVESTWLLWCAWCYAWCCWCCNASCVVAAYNHINSTWYIHTITTTHTHQVWEVLLRMQLTPTQAPKATLNATLDYSYADTRQAQRNTAGGAASNNTSNNDSNNNTSNNTSSSNTSSSSSVAVVPRFVEPNPRITATQQGRLLWGTAPTAVCVCLFVCVCVFM